MIRLPAYASEFDPVEALWAWLKKGRLASLPVEAIDLLPRRMRRGVRAGRRRLDPLLGLLAKTAPPL